MTGAVLDAGCGTGENALFFAERGHPVLGIDFLEGPIQEARRKAAERGLDAKFIPMDALTLTDARPAVRQRDRQRPVPRLLRRGPGPLRRRAGPCDEAGRAAVPAVLQRREPGTQGPRRVSERELREAFTDGWVVEEVRPARFEVRPDLEGISFSEGGPKAWFSVISVPVNLRPVATGRGAGGPNDFSLDKFIDLTIVVNLQGVAIGRPGAQVRVGGRARSFARAAQSCLWRRWTEVDPGRPGDHFHLTDRLTDELARARHIGNVLIQLLLLSGPIRRPVTCVRGTRCRRRFAPG